MVWCDGGCEGGVFRHTDKEVTEKHVKIVERNAKRLRQWYRNKKYRDGKGEDGG